MRVKAGNRKELPTRERWIGHQCSRGDCGPKVPDGVTPVQGLRDNRRIGGRGLYTNRSTENSNGQQYAAPRSNL